MNFGKIIGAIADVGRAGMKGASRTGDDMMRQVENSFIDNFMTKKLGAGWQQKAQMGDIQEAQARFAEIMNRTKTAGKYGSVGAGGMMVGSLGDEQ